MGYDTEEKTWKIFEDVAQQYNFESNRLIDGISSNQNFDRNLKSLKCSHEQYILSVGTFFDERLLFNNQINFQANTPTMDIADEYDEATRQQHQMKTPLPETKINSRKLRKLFGVYSLKIADDAVLKKINEKLSSITNRLSACLPDTPECENCVKNSIINSLYYILLEKIVRVEVNNNPHLDLKIILDSESFHTTLIECCAAIVLKSYESLDLKFPWILDFFKIDAFNFYKIIELVVDRNDSLLASLHLNYIEELCLEHLAWISSSSLWEIIAQNSQTLPAWIVDVDANTDTNSPISSTFDTFNAVASGDDGGSSSSDLGHFNKFFKNFYKLALLRIKELCKELNIVKYADLKKIWTLFEYSIMRCTDLMRDRHLDQIIMCTIYIFTRVTEYSNVRFIDIVRTYRQQPQALSSTYREVLIGIYRDDRNERKPIFKDLIYFYNNIYVQEMTPYALKYSKSTTENTKKYLNKHRKRYI